MRLRYKKWADDYVNQNQDVAYREDRIDKLPSFNQLEIGSGLGEFLITKAYNNPDIKYLGVEVCYSAFAISVKKLVTFQQEHNVKLNNIIFLNAPVEKLFPYLKNDSLDCIYLNFNDPWPKKRHNKRRLTYPTKLDIYYNLLKLNGKILYKTDNDLYYEDSKKYFTFFNKFDVTFIDDYQQLDEGDVLSEYERKFREKGNIIHRIIGVKSK